jgi:hypothetical protein
MTPLSPQLKRIPAALHGDWFRRWERNIWEGTISCDEPFVTLIVARLETELFWAKSLPSKDNSIQLQLDLMPTSKTEPLFQLHFLAPTGAFIQNITARFTEPDYRPTISAPAEFETGLVVPFAMFSSRLDFSFACFAKTDAVVRRHYVWGLKPRFLDGIKLPWREILARGCNGETVLPVAA